MNSCLEYIVAGTLICLILGISGNYTTDMVYDKINLVEINQESEKAAKILDLMLLSDGKPPNWDEYPQDPDILGFSQTNSIKMYNLDKDKIIRLQYTSPSYISPNRIKELIGLGPEYYIAIKIFPLLNITMTRETQDSFKVQFFNQWNTPASNVNVTVAYLNHCQAADITQEELQLFLDLELDGLYDSELSNSIGISTLYLTGAEELGCMLINSKQLTGNCLFIADINNTNISFNNSPHIIYQIESSMGSVSGYNSEIITRTVKIDGFDYIFSFTLWS